MKSKESTLTGFYEKKQITGLSFGLFICITEIKLIKPKLKENKAR